MLFRWLVYVVSVQVVKKTTTAGPKKTRKAVESYKIYIYKVLKQVTFLLA